MADTSHSNKVSGINGLYVGAAGSEVQVASPTGALYQSGTAVTASAAELNIMDGVTATAAELNLLGGTDRIVRVERVAIAATDTAGGLFHFTPGEAILVQRVLLDVTTKATGACTVDVGIAANATTLSDTLIDGLDVNAAAGLFDNLTDNGTNGKSRQKCSATQSVTGSVASGASAGIVGYAYIEYLRV